MNAWIAKHGRLKLLLPVAVMLCAYAVFSGGRYVLHQMLVAKVHAGMCRSKPDAPHAKPLLFSSNQTRPIPGQQR